MAKSAATAKTPESHHFQAEVAKLLKLMVHSVYSDRDVFLRELVSNSADALDKLRYEAIAQPELLEGGGELAITIAADKAAKTVTVSDSGIGMSREELIDNLGTIARSGTQAFLENLSAGGETPKLIGQFGIGFYAAFMVAASVEVTSRRAGSAEAWVWTSDGEGAFTVAPAGADTARGTRIVLALKDDCLDYAEDWKIEQVIRSYSDHIAHPIMLAVGSETARQINSASAIWTRPKAEVTADQHKAFFSLITALGGEPALTLHYRAEGRHEYTVLLYVPSEKPFDLYDPERRGRQKLYVRRVFISDQAEMLPAYLRFVRGVIDSQDMPLNISREMLQDNPQVAAIRKAVTARVLSELKKFAETDPSGFAKIWEAFGPVLKEGLYEDMENRDKLYEIVRFRTTKAPSVSLKDYIAGLKTNQTAIYYLTAEDAAKAEKSPQLEGFRARDVEVLLLSDPVDSFWVRTALGYEGKPFTSVTQGSADLDAIAKIDGATADAEDEGATALLIARMKQALGEQVSEVRKSARLTGSAVCLVAGSGGFDRTLEKLLARQKTTEITASAPVLEINPGHPLIVSLAKAAKSGGVSPEIDTAAHMLLDQARILDGEPVGDPAAFAARLQELMSRSLGL